MRIAAHDREFEPLAHEIGIATGAKRFPGAEHRDRFEQIALALRVGTDEHVEPRRRIQIELRVVPKIRKRQMRQLHVVIRRSFVIPSVAQRSRGTSSARSIEYQAA